MEVIKRIYWRPDLSKPGADQYANVHLLVGYKLKTFAAYKEMVEQLRETFPQAIEESIFVGDVQKPCRFQYFSIVSWSGPIPASEYPGWTQRTISHRDDGPEYY